MNDLPLLTIIITTYDPGDNSRFSLLYRTIESMRLKLRYPNLAWIIADDGSSVSPEHSVRQLLEGHDVSFINANRQGVGRSKNLSLKQAFEKSDFVLLAEDDWELKEPLSLAPHVEVLRDNEETGMIRFGYLGGKIEATYVDYGFPKTYWKLKHKSGHYVYSGQISLRSKIWYDVVGYHTENVQAGTEEEEMCHRVNDLPAIPDILWPGEYGTTLNAGAFINIGLNNSVNTVESGVTDKTL